MSDNLNQYMLSSHCTLIDCFDGCEDIPSCRECKDKMLADHDKQIRNEILDNVQLEVSEKIEKQIREEAIIETLESVIKMIDDWGYEDLSSVVLRENLKARIEQMKGANNE